MWTFFIVHFYFLFQIMAHFTSFEELEIYQKANLFCNEIWNIIINTPLEKDYKLREQINGSSGL